MMTYFSLNTRYSNLYYSILMIFTISIIYNLIILSIYKERPTSKQMQQWIILIGSVVIYHLFIDPSVQVNVLDDKYNNDHIAKI